MFTFYKLVQELIKYGKKAVAWAWAHKAAILKLIERKTTVGQLVKYVLDRM